MLADSSVDDGTCPVGGYLVPAYVVAGCGLTGFVLQIQTAMSLLDRARAGPVTIREPGAGEGRSVAAAILATRPVSSIRPVDLTAIRTERAGDELPARRLNLVRALQITRRGVAVLIGQGEEDTVAGDRGVLAGISLRAPCAEEA